MVLAAFRGGNTEIFFIDSTLPHLIHSQTYIEKPDPLMHTVHYETAIREPNKNINLHPKSEKYVLTHILAQVPVRTR